ncbi:MAG: type II toxin-antitoxin system RelE/ParE family toxin [Sedimentisphaerales bacterium]|nr:type II toxin-antitoxin system RelE/ParE family toxin [Sedimentisphaerales bacterium]
MIYSFHPEAEEEFLRAIDYYERREKDLGLDFAIEVHAAIDRAAALPNAWPVVEGDIRRCQTQRFPYGVLYTQEPDGLFVLAVMHLHREPGYWRHRLG